MCVCVCERSNSDLSNILNIVDACQRTSYLTFKLINLAFFSTDFGLDGMGKKAKKHDDL